MSELKIGENNYRIGRLDARKQLHVARRLAPLLAGAGEVADGPNRSVSDVIRPVADALAKMSDEDIDFIVDVCLSVCHRQQGQAYAPVFARGTGLMFDDIQLPELMQLTSYVVQENLGNFFGAGGLAAAAAA